MRVESKLVSITRQPAQTTLEAAMWAALSVIVLLVGSTMAVVGPPEHDQVNSTAQAQPNGPLVTKTTDKAQPHL